MRPRSRRARPLDSRRRQTRRRTRSARAVVDARATARSSRRCSRRRALPAEVGASRPPLASHARRAAERLDREPGVVGDRRDAAAHLVEVARLRQRVLLERVERLEASSSSDSSISDSSSEIQDVEPGGCEQRAQARAACRRCASPAARRRRAHRASALALRGIERRDARAPPDRAARPARARSNVPCSPVPCTSTNRPSLLITTFMSTSARTSSS